MWRGPCLAAPSATGVKAVAAATPNPTAGNGAATAGARRKAGAMLGGAFCTLPRGGAALGAAGTTLGTVGGLPGGGPPGMGEAAGEGWACVEGAAAAGGACWVLP